MEPMNASIEALEAPLFGQFVYIHGLEAISGELETARYQPISARLRGYRHMIG
jgi:hypothetical protein